MNLYCNILYLISSQYFFFKSFPTRDSRYAKKNYRKLLAAGSNVTIELNPELEFVVTVEDRPFNVDDGVCNGTDF